MQQGWLVFVYMTYGALQSRTDSRGRNHLEAMSLTCLVVVLVVCFNLPCQSEHLPLTSLSALGFFTTWWP